MERSLVDVIVETLAIRIADTVSRDVCARLGKPPSDPQEPQPSTARAPPEDADLVDVEQAAVITSIPKRTLDNWRGKHAQRLDKGPAFVKLGKGRNALVRYWRKDLDEWMNRFLGRLRADPDAAEAEYDRLPQGTIALAGKTAVGSAFTAGRWVRYYCAADDLDGLFDHLRVNESESGGVMWLLDRVRPYGDALDTAAEANQAAFKDFVTEEGEPWRSALMGRARVKAAVEEVLEVEPEVVDWEEFEALNREYVKEMAEGAGAVFWQYGSTLVIGGQYRHPYGDRLLGAGGGEGTLTMVARGHGLSAGAVEVSGATDQTAFKRAFAMLKPEHRAVLVLTAVHGLSYEAIAEVCGCQVGTVKSRISRARRHLKEILVGESEQPSPVRRKRSVTLMIFEL